MLNIFLLHLSSAHFHFSCHGIYYRSIAFNLRIHAPSPSGYQVLPLCFFFTAHYDSNRDIFTPVALLDYSLLKYYFQYDRTALFRCSALLKYAA
jgi:hypothetical protein